MPRSHGIFDSERELLEMAAIAMNRQADAALDGCPEWDLESVPTRWAYAMLAIASWIESEVQNHNARTRPFAVAAATAWFRDVEATADSYLAPGAEGEGDA